MITCSVSILIEDLSSSDDDTRPAKTQKKLVAKQLDEKAESSKACRRTSRHTWGYNKSQYKLWAEAIDVKKHNSTEYSPPGAIWRETPKDSNRPTVAQFTRLLNSHSMAV